jgi:hypothetical protein
MSNMFRGTMLKKSPAANVAMAMSLEELDRVAYCPENVDEESWKHLCKIRRDKIQSEERIQALEADIAETDQVRRHSFKFISATNDRTALSSLFLKILCSGTCKARPKLARLHKI